MTTHRGLDLREMRMVFQDIARCDGALSLAAAAGRFSHSMSYAWNIAVRDQRAATECVYVDYATFRSYYPAIGPAAVADPTYYDNPSQRAALTWPTVLRIFEMAVAQHPHWVVDGISLGSSGRYWLSVSEYPFPASGQAVTLVADDDFILSARCHLIATYDDWLALNPDADAKTGNAV